MSAVAELPRKLVGGIGKHKLAVILAVVLIAAVVLAVILLTSRPAVKIGTVRVMNEHDIFELPGEELLRNRNGKITEYAGTDPQLLTDIPHFEYSDLLLFSMNGMFNQKYYVSTYSDSYELLTEDADSPVVPAEPGSYLLRFEVFWGEADNFVSSQHFAWVDVQ